MIVWTEVARKQCASVTVTVCVSLAAIAYILDSFVTVVWSIRSAYWTDGVMVTWARCYMDQSWLWLPKTIIPPHRVTRYHLQYKRFSKDTHSGNGSSKMPKTLHSSENKRNLMITPNKRTKITNDRSTTQLIRLSSTHMKTKPLRPQNAQCKVPRID